MSKWSSFIRGYGIGQRMVEDYDKAKKKRELRDVADAEPEEAIGFTADQGDQLRAAAESGQYDIGIKTKEDGTFDSYTVTPKADPTQTGVIAQQGVTDFLGKRTAGSMGAEEVANARQIARAGVYRRHGDDETGSRLEREVREGERAARNDEWTEKTRTRTEAGWKRDDEYEAGRVSLFENSNYSDVERTNAQAQSSFRDAMRIYEEAAKRGDTSAVKPTAPQLRRYGSAEALQDQLAGLAFETKHGKADFGKLTEVTKKIRDMEDEGYTRALEVAMNGGKPEQVSGAFNATGSVHIKPESLRLTMGETMVRGVKVPTAFVTFTDEKTGRTSTINAASELAAYKGAKSILDTQFAVNQDKRAANADARAGASAARTAADDAQDRTDKKALRAASAELERATQSGDPAAINAARIKVVEAGGKLGDGSGKDEPSDLQMARAALQARVPGVKDMAGALQWARSSREKPMAEVRADIYAKALAAKTGNAKAASKETDAAMEYLFPQAWAEEQPWNAGQKREGPANAPYADGTELKGKDGKTYVVRNGVPVPRSIAQDPRAVAIRNDKNMTIEEKRKKLQELGYQ